MTDADEVDSWHRQFGASFFNRTWDLIDQPDRSPADDMAMLLSAAASRCHWGAVGGPAEIATGDWQVAHVASLLGYADIALLFASACLEAARVAGFDGWRLASAHEGMARAYAAAGDVEERDRHVELARDALTREPSAEERQVIENQIATVPPGV